MILLDSLSYAGRPSSAELGLAPIVVTDRRMYARRADGSLDLARGDEGLTRQLARETAAAQAMLCLDIEHLHLDARTATDGQIEAGIDHIGQIIDWIRSERPCVRVGLYGILPLFEYWKRDVHWKSANARLRVQRDERTGKFIARGLADLVDFVAPSLYTFYDDLPGWERFAIETGREAARYQKPPYGFVHGRFHPAAQPESLRGTLIPRPMYQRQCEIVAEHFDGAVIWDGWDTVNNRTLAWDEEALVRVEIAKRAARMTTGAGTGGETGGGAQGETA